MASTTMLLGARLPNDRFLFIAVALAARPAGAAALHPPRPDHPRWCREPHHGRGARHQRAPDVHDRLRPRRPAAALAGLLYPQYAGTVSPRSGSLLIYAFIVVVIGGMGSLVGTAVAAVAVGLVQQLANFYAASGVGDLSVVLLLALVLLLRPTSMKGAHA